MSTDITKVHHGAHSAALEPWQSWGSTLRYVIARMAQAIPTAVLAWLAYIRHLG